MNTKNKIWHHIKKTLETDISHAEFTRWLSETSLVKIDSDQAVIHVPNKFIAQWIEENYSDKIRATLKQQASVHPEIVFRYPSPSVHQAVGDNIGVKRADATLPGDIDPLNTFDSFVTSGANHMAYSSAVTMADTPGCKYNPLYIFSPLSVGKTHLLHAIGNRVLTTDPGSSVVYLSISHLLGEPSPDSQVRLPALWTDHSRCDCLLVDDIDLLAGQPEAQKSTLYIFDLFVKFNQRLALTASAAPNKVQELIPHLRSRLESGVITEIAPPDHKTKIKIIERKSNLNNLTLSEDVSFFLAGATDNLKTVNKTIQALKTHHERTGEEIDIATAQMIASDDARQPPGISRIQAVTADYFNIPVAELSSSRKERAFSHPRQIAMYLSKNLTALSLKAIGEAFGHRHHTSVMYAVNRIQAQKAHNSEVIRHINDLQKKLIPGP